MTRATASGAPLIDDVMGCGLTYARSWRRSIHCKTRHDYYFTPRKQNPHLPRRRHWHKHLCLGSESERESALQSSRILVARLGGHGGHGIAWRIRLPVFARARPGGDATEGDRLSCLKQSLAVSSTSCVPPASAHHRASLAINAISHPGTREIAQQQAHENTENARRSHPRCA